MHQALGQLCLKTGQGLLQLLAAMARLGHGLRQAAFQRFAKTAHGLLAALVQLAQLQTQVLRQVAERTLAARQRLHRAVLRSLLLAPLLGPALLPFGAQVGRGLAHQQQHNNDQGRHQQHGQQYQFQVFQSAILSRYRTAFTAMHLL